MKTTYLSIVLISAVFAGYKAATYTPGCSELQVLAKRHAGDLKEERLRILRATADEYCSRTTDQLTPGATLKYRNGQVAVDRLGAAEARWYLPDGKEVTAPTVSAFAYLR